jgi:hypothetical protein
MSACCMAHQTALVLDVLDAVQAKACVCDSIERL